MVLHLFAVLVAASTLLLIFAGGLVTSTGSGLAVPDWPSTYGWFMFSFPLDKMVGGIFYEHGHRLIASTVGFLIVVLAVWLWRAEPRRWVRRLGFLALAAVIAQGILGGITVLLLLPDAISISHAGLAQLVWCLTVTIALVTSRGWLRGYADRSGTITPDDGRLRTIACVTTAGIYLQILVGATMRHTEAGLAIPDFPLAFGHLLPPQWDPKIAVHFVHRLGALGVTLLVLTTAARVIVRHRNRPELVRPAALLVGLVAVQVTLGAYVIWTAKQFILNSAHVATGGMVLATALVLALRANRARFARSAASRPAYGYNAAYVRTTDLPPSHGAPAVRQNPTPSAGANA
jgi:cytochrome c oxidase assembly protein subunit 15